VRLNPTTVQQIDSPIGTAYALVDHRAKERELLDLAQAAPQYPTAPEVIEHIASVARHARGGGYVEIAGLPHLREVFAAELRAAYRGQVRQNRGDVLGRLADAIAIDRGRTFEVPID